MYLLLHRRSKDYKLQGMGNSLYPDLFYREIIQIQNIKKNKICSRFDGIRKRELSNQTNGGGDVGGEVDEVVV